MKSSMKLAVAAGALALAAISLNNAPAQARRAFARGAHGAIGGYASQGAWGQRAGARAIGANAGAGIRGGHYVGPNGGKFNTAGVFGYKRGIGAFRKSGWNGTAANGASGYGYTKSKYNAQTGQGTRSSSEQIKTAAGQNYGYSGSTSYTKGQGGQSTIDTDHHGDYNVDWAKGQKPVVTSDGSSSK